MSKGIEIPKWTCFGIFAVRETAQKPVAVGNGVMCHRG